jgi:DNA ligase D-like protein (predicted 3'-phosphoesterase)
MPNAAGRDRPPKRRTGARPSRGRRVSGSERPLFVIQKHRARRLHYDFRLEVAGVLKSWAIPKGPSTETKDRRLAVLVEDHPLRYAAFEGNIAEGEYGAGAVIVWDAGYYRQLQPDGEQGPKSVAQAIKNGYVEVYLEGQKIKGGYKLVQVRIGGSDKNWLLVKKHDEHANAGRNPVATDPRSVLSGRTVEEVAAEAGDQS